jgi:glyoxylase-like metal-dependent hydrolase (beta-lactamase superfamily II)
VVFEKQNKDHPNITKIEGFKEFLGTQLSHFHSIKATEAQRQKLVFEDDPLIAFLGTGSMMPATFRNVSAISLTANHRFNILLDCGEGTFAQLVESVGSKHIDAYLQDLRVIYITHIHPDHNLGLFKVLAERKALEQRLKTKFAVASAQRSPSSS